MRQSPFYHSNCLSKQLTLPVTTSLPTQANGVMVGVKSLKYATEVKAVAATGNIQILI